jgi:hypothetical protein
MDLTLGPKWADGGLVSQAEWERRLLVLHGATETDHFFDAIFQLLAATVNCQWSLVHLRLLKVGIPLIGWDSRRREYGAKFWQHFFSLNPAVPYVAAHPGIKVPHPRQSGLCHGG